MLNEQHQLAVLARDACSICRRFLGVGFKISIRWANNSVGEARSDVLNRSLTQLL